MRQGNVHIANGLGSGVVESRALSAGDYVNTQSAITTINDLSRLKVEFQVPERHLAKVRPGTAFRVKSGAVAGGEPVEGAHLHRLRPDQVGHPPAHLVGRLVGEGERDDRRRRHAHRDQVGHAMGDDPGLTAARTCQHQERSLDVGGGSTLRLIQSVEKR